MRIFTLLILVLTASFAFAQNVIKLSQLIPGAANHKFINPYEFQGKLYFNGGTSDGLYSFDGVNAPTFIADLDPFSNWGAPIDFCKVDSILYISAAGYLWKYDGVNPPTKVWTSNYGNLKPKYLTNFKGKLYFAGNLVGNPAEPLELLVYDGVSPPIKAFIQTSPTYPLHLQVYKNRLMFLAMTSNWNYELFRFDTTSMGLQQLSNLTINGATALNNYVTICNGLFYFNDGFDLYSYDGTPTAPSFVGYTYYPIKGLMCYDKKLFGQGFTSSGFFMYDGDTSKFLASGFDALEAYGQYGTQPLQFFEFNNLIYFCGDAPTSVGFFERDLIVADTLGHAYRLDIFPYTFPYGDDSNPMSFIEFQGRPYFFAIDSASGWQIHTLTCNNFIDTTLIYIDLMNRLQSPQVSSSIFPTTYQWVRCDSGYAPIAGATNEFYDMNSNGSYAVIINRFGCIDTSMCFTMNSFGLDEVDSSPVSVFPNPTNGGIQINALAIIKKLTITSSHGKLLVELFPNINNPAIAMPEPCGVYYLRLEDENGAILTKKVIKF